MFRFIAISALFSIAFGKTLQNDLNGRLVNGEDTTITKHPYQVAVLSVNTGLVCSGSIINKNTIVTAAHCIGLHRLDQMRVRLGSTSRSTGGILVKVKSWFAHPNYSNVTNAYDVGIMKLAQDIPKSSTIRYIALANKDYPTGTRAVVTGWGKKCFKCKINPDNMQQIDIRIVSRTDCASNKYKYGKLILKTMICAYKTGTDACIGDSGDPLVVNNQLVGLVSFGQECALKGYPGVYADVPSLRSWIIKKSA